MYCVDPSACRPVNVGMCVNRAVDAVPSVCSCIVYPDTTYQLLTANNYGYSATGYALGIPCFKTTRIFVYLHDISHITSVLCRSAIT